MFSPMLFLKLPNITPLLKTLHWLKIINRTNRIQSNITHIQHTSILPALLPPSAIHDATTSFNPLLFHSNIILRPSVTSSLKFSNRPIAIAVPPHWNNLPPVLRQISDPSYELTQTSPLAISPRLS